MQIVDQAISVGSPVQAGPSPIHLQQIAEARDRGKRVRRAARFAALSGWSLAIFALITCLSGLFDLPALALGAGLGLAACFELRGARELKRLNGRAAGQLAWNQIFLGAVIVAYAGFCLWQALYGQSPLSTGDPDPQVEHLLGSFDDLARTISAAYYAGLAVAGIVIPGCTAAYYASRRRHVEEVVAHTPRWIVDLNRKGISV